MSRRNGVAGGQLQLVKPSSTTGLEFPTPTAMSSTLLRLSGHAKHPRHELQS